MAISVYNVKSVFDGMTKTSSIIVTIVAYICLIHYGDGMKRYILHIAGGL